MSMILGLILAGALTRTTPTASPGTWISPSDYPVGAMRRGEQGTVGFTLLVSSTGKVVQCSVQSSSGFPELDQRTCVAVTLRGQFTPAADENGKPVYDSYTGRMTWRLPYHNLRPKPAIADAALAADMEVRVKKLPGSLPQQDVRLLVRIDETGRVAYCEPRKDGTSSAKLEAIGCAQAKSSYALVEKDDKGTPISLIRSLLIRFKTDPL